MKYEGKWKKGYYHGEGIMYGNNNTVMYCGEFEESKKNGKGILYLNGGYVVSEWKNDLPVGKGEFWYQNGKKKINLLASKNKMVLFDN